jgi:hypothetical protein
MVHLLLTVFRHERSRLLQQQQQQQQLQEERQRRPLIRAIPSETFRGKPPRKSGQNGDNVVITNWAIFCQTFGIFETNILFIFFKLISKVQVIFSAFL